jgi:hypothetical protein
MWIEHGGCVPLHVCHFLHKIQIICIVGFLIICSVSFALYALTSVKFVRCICTCGCVRRYNIDPSCNQTQKFHQGIHSLRTTPPHCNLPCIADRILWKPTCFLSSPCIINCVSNHADYLMLGLINNDKEYTLYDHQHPWYRTLHDNLTWLHWYVFPLHISLQYIRWDSPQLRCWSTGLASTADNGKCWVTKSNGSII